MTEIFKDIANYEGLYQISNHGRVKSLQRKNVGKIMSLTKCPKGYLHITLPKNNSKKTFRISRLVAQAFIKNPKKKPCVNHKDAVKANNFVTNLEWCTYSENNKHAWANNLNSAHTKRIAQVKYGLVVKIWESMNAAAKSVGVHQSSISLCCAGKMKSCKNFEWRYA